MRRGNFRLDACSVYDFYSLWVQAYSKLELRLELSPTYVSRKSCGIILARWDSKGSSELVCVDFFPQSLIILTELDL